jgi:hypothetical protein
MAVPFTFTWLTPCPRPGTNAAYMEAVDRVPKWGDAPPGASQVVINIEWGNLSAPSLPRLAADEALDAQSPNPGQQAFEKLVAGMYLGRIAGLTLLQVDAETPGGARLLTDAQRARLQADDGLTTPLLSTVANDTSPGTEQARAALAAALGEPLSDDALHTISEICRLVTRRAARLSAAAIVGVLEHCGAGTGAPGDVPTVAVDGGAFHDTVFHATLLTSLRLAQACSSTTPHSRRRSWRRWQAWAPWPFSGSRPTAPGSGRRCSRRRWTLASVVYTLLHAPTTTCDTCHLSHLPGEHIPARRRLTSLLGSRAAWTAASRLMTTC